MIVTGLVNLVNMLLAYGQIFGHFGLPALGAADSAWGASLARAVGAVVLLALLATNWRRVSLRGRSDLIWRDVPPRSLCGWLWRGCVRWAWP